MIINFIKKKILNFKLLISYHTITNINIDIDKL